MSRSDAAVVASTMNQSFIVRDEQDALIVSFSAPARVLSWAVTNGGFCYADHVINHHIMGSDQGFSVDPQRWLEESASRLGLQGTVVALATGVEMKNLVEVSFSAGDNSVICFATVGCSNALSVGDPASVVIEQVVPSPLHTINMILTVQPGLEDRALAEAIQIATEGRVLRRASKVHCPISSPPARAPIVLLSFLSAMSASVTAASILSSAN